MQFYENPLKVYDIYNFAKKPSNFIKSLQDETSGQDLAGDCATSPENLDRRIGCVDGLDRARTDHFAKRPFHLSKIVPTVHGFFKKGPKLLGKFHWHPHFCKKDLLLTKNYALSP